MFTVCASITHSFILLFFASLLYCYHYRCWCCVKYECVRNDLLDFSIKMPWTVLMHSNDHKNGFRNPVLIALWKYLWLTKPPEILAFCFYFWYFLWPNEIITFKSDQTKPASEIENPLHFGAEYIVNQWFR